MTGRWFRGYTLVLIGALVAPIAPALAVVQDDCVDTIPPEEVSAGDRGAGLTVAVGTTPMTFDVEVLGVLEDGIAPGRDMILVEVSGAIIDAAGGIWAGMSGSPIYIDGRLLGALSYGFSPASRIAGVTPAADLLGVGEADAGRTILGDRTLLRQFTAASATGAEALRLPVALAGLPNRYVDRMQTAFDRAGWPTLIHTSGGRLTSGDTGGDDAASIVAGGNFAVVLATGDLDAYAAGTVSYTCEGDVVAFGHPFQLAGPVRMGAASGRALGVIEDPVWGPWKLISLGDLVGTVGEDRLAGVRATLGGSPEGTVLRSTVTATDTDRTRIGHTRVLFDQLLGDLVMSHMIGNVDSVFDQITRGNAVSAWMVSGRRADGTPWTYERTNRFTDDWDINWNSHVELLGDLYAMQNNPFEEVAVTTVDVDYRVTSQVDRYTLGQVQVSSDGVVFDPVGTTYTTPGSALTFRIELLPYGQLEPEYVDLVLEIPPDVIGYASLEITGGAGSSFDPWQCVYDPTSCAGGATTFPDLLTAFAERPRNDDLSVRLQLYVGPAPEGPTPIESVLLPEDASALQLSPSQMATEGDFRTIRSSLRLDRVVTGSAYGEVLIEPADGVPTGGVTRIAGADRVTTAVAASQRGYPGADTVVLVRADDSADGLTAVPLAASMAAPVLLTPGSRLDPAVAEEITRLGATRVVVVGGPAAVSESVMTALAELGVETERIAGANRFETARLVALRLGGSEVMLVNADRWPDAVAASVLAALQHRPLLLVARDAVPPASTSYLIELGVSQVTIVGGESAVSSEVSAGLMADGLDVVRLAGADRYATSRLVADRAVEAGADPLDLVVATGRDFPDPLVATTLAASRFGVTLLVDGSDATPVTTWLEQFPGTTVTLVGGTSALSSEFEHAVTMAVSGS